MRFDLRAFPGGAPHLELYQAMLRQVSWCETHLAPDSFVVSEHHASPDGYCPAPLEVAAALAAITAHAQVQVAAVIAPLHDPVRLAESAAVVDLLSGGRLELVLVGGYRPSEFELFGRSPDGRGAVVEETARILRRCWAGRPPTPGATGVVTPAPSGPSSPRIIFGGGTRQAARRAATLGDGFIPAGPASADLIEVYRAERHRQGKDAGFVGGGRAPLAVHVAHDVEAGWATIGPYVVHDSWMYATWGAEAAGLPTPAPPSVDEVRAEGRYVVVTPDECVDLWSSLPPEAALFLHPLVGGADPEIGWSSLRLFAEQVGPRLERTDREPTTT